MSKRNKSRLTKADLGRVLRLQQDYDNLCQDVLQLMMFIMDYEQFGTVRRNIEYSNCFLSLCHEKIDDAIKDGRYDSKKSRVCEKTVMQAYDEAIDAEKMQPAFIYVRGDVSNAVTEEHAQDVNKHLEEVKKYI